MFETSRFSGTCFQSRNVRTHHSISRLSHLQSSGHMKLLSTSRSLPRKFAQDFEPERQGFSGAQKEEADYLWKKITRHPAREWKVAPGLSNQMRQRHNMPTREIRPLNLDSYLQQFWAERHALPPYEELPEIRSESHGSVNFFGSVLKPITFITQADWAAGTGDYQMNWPYYVGNISTSDSAVEQNSSTRPPTADYELTINETVIAVGEFKNATVFDLSKTPDFIKELTADGPRDVKLPDKPSAELKRFQAALHQVTFYAYIYQVAWAWLSTGRETIFLRFSVIDEDNDPPQMRVEVSKPYSFKEGTYSIVQAMLAVTAIALTGVDKGLPAEIIKDYKGITVYMRSGSTSSGSFSKQEFTAVDFKLGLVLGTGSFAQVRSGVFQGKAVAVKIPGSDTHELMDCYDQAEDELAVLQHIQSQAGVAVVRLVDWGHMEWGGCKRPIIVLERAQGCSLLQASNHPFVRREVFSALQTLHDLSVVHGDLHGGNILVQDTMQGPKVTFIDLRRARLHASQAELEAEQHQLKVLLDKVMPAGMPVEVATPYSFAITNA